jgi:hypothetical protein
MKTTVATLIVVLKGGAGIKVELGIIIPVVCTTAGLLLVLLM